MKRKVTIGVLILGVTAIACAWWLYYQKSHPKEWDGIIFIDTKADPGFPENFERGMDVEILMRTSDKYPYGFLRWKWGYFCSKNSVDDAAKEMVAFLQTLPGVTDVKIWSPPNSDVVAILYNTPKHPFGRVTFHSKEYYEKYLKAKELRENGKR